MEGNPLGQNRENKAENTHTPLDARITEFATDFEAPLKEQTEIMRNAKSLIEKLQNSPGLKPEAVSKVIAGETARYLAAKTELTRLQAENEKRLKRHYQ